jgi:hypothetical protein
MIFDSTFIDSRDLPNEIIRNGRSIILSQESACKPILITRHLSSHKLGTLLEAATIPVVAQAEIAGQLTALGFSNFSPCRIITKRCPNVNGFCK